MSTSGRALEPVGQARTPGTLSYALVLTWAFAVFSAVRLVSYGNALMCGATALMILIHR